jgi:hypothetical protein
LLSSSLGDGSDFSSFGSSPSFLSTFAAASLSEIIV